MTTELVNAILLLCFSHCYVFVRSFARNQEKASSPWDPNYCNDTTSHQDAGLTKTALGQFLGYDCDQIFFHCRLTVSGWKTYKKSCRVGLVFDTSGTQNCNYNFNVAGCGSKHCDCNSEQYACCLSEECIDLAGRCDGKYDCSLEEDEQNCASCSRNEFPCTLSEQCVSMDKRCDGTKDCKDGTDEQFCKECGTSMFWCRKSAECIDRELRCNGNKDCRFGDDESFCSNPPLKQYLCEDQKNSVMREDVCNGIADCPDGSDELYCADVNLSQVVPQKTASLESSLVETENVIGSSKSRKSLAKDDTLKTSTNGTIKANGHDTPKIELDGRKEKQDRKQLLANSTQPMNNRNNNVQPDKVGSWTNSHILEETQPKTGNARNSNLSKPWWKNELFFTTDQPLKIGQRTNSHTRRPKKTVMPRIVTKRTTTTTLSSTSTQDTQSEYFYDD